MRSVLENDQLMEQVIFLLSTNSWKELKVKISGWHFINPVEWFSLNVKLQVLRFLIPQILEILKLSFISTNFAMDFLFGSGLPSLASTLELKKVLKSPVSLFSLISNFLMGFEAAPKFLLAPCQYDHYTNVLKYTSASSIISRIKLLPALSVFCLLWTKYFLPG